LTACRLAGHRVIEDARSQVTRRRGGHNRQELTHAAFKATEATAPEATEAATTTASGIAGTPSRVSSSRAHLAVRLALHMTVSQAGPNWEHHAMAKVLIIGGSRGNGLETAKAAL
jgi:hypothetical protein